MWQRARIRPWSAAEQREFHNAPLQPGDEFWIWVERPQLRDIKDLWRFDVWGHPLTCSPCPPGFQGTYYDTNIYLTDDANAAVLWDLIETVAESPQDFAEDVPVTTLEEIIARRPA